MQQALEAEWSSLLAAVNFAPGSNAGGTQGEEQMQMQIREPLFLLLFLFFSNYNAYLLASSIEYVPF